MANLVMTILFVLVITFVVTVANAELGVFETGKVSNTYFKVEELEPSSPPKPLLIVTPSVDGEYPVIMFLHGTCLLNSFYTDLLQHISSHGYIVVAPQIYYCLNGLIPMLPISGPAELESAAEVAKWLPSGLQSVLPENVIADLNKFSVGGHSRGGKTAFALALGYAKTPLQLQISALVGVDPVEGTSKNNPTQPKILTYIPQSLNLSIPVAVIGTGLGDEPVCWLVCPACAPDKMNHAEYFDECKAPAGHFVTAEYGHMDMLNDNITDIVGRLTGSLCKSSPQPRQSMRRTIGGVVVAFLKDYFEGESEDYLTIVKDPSVAPAKLDPVQIKSA